VGGTGSLDRRHVIAAFGVATLVALALVAAALVLRGGDTAVSDAPPVDFTGIAQEGALLGSPEAGVRLVEYADQQCPACASYATELFPVVLHEYVRPGLVATEYRGFPFIGEDSVKAYRFLLAAAEQDRLWQLQDALYRNQGGENDGWVTDELIRSLASDIDGLDVERLFSDAERADIVAEAEGADAAAQAAGITGTPTLLVAIGDEDPYLIQIRTADEMRAALDDALRG
jgi:protein-disulfide isomerase